MSFDSEFRIVQHGHTVCAVSGPGPAARSQILHYAAQYGQDGPIKIEVRVGKRWEDAMDLLAETQSPNPC